MAAVDYAGIKRQRTLHMVNTNMHEFKHPNYYKELRKRNKLAESRQPVVGGQQQSDQVISRGDSTEAGRRSPGPGLKQQAASDKPQAKPKNLVIRFSAPMVDQRAPASWPNSSSVVTKDQPWFGATSVMCPAPKQNNECKDCRQCWNPEIKTISYGKH